MLPASRPVSLARVKASIAYSVMAKAEDAKARDIVLMKLDDMKQAGCARNDDGAVYPCWP